MKAPCPEQHGLERLLAGQLSPEEDRALSRHVELCPDCQTRLQALTDPAPDDLFRPGADRPLPPQPRPTGGLRGSTFLLGELPVDLLTPPQPLPGRHQPSLPVVPGYEVLEEIGRGGMGVIYRARHERLNRVVALKMIGGAAGPSLLARFRTEGEVVARLRHPNIVSVFDVGEADGRPYLSLELVSGGSLKGRLGHPTPVSEAARLIETVSRAVAAAHAAGVVHRDLKPANILLEADGTPKVSDFGLAKLLDEEGGQARTQTGEVLGTPAYMAPEQAAGRARDVGPATDVWALGAILYELLTGRPPFAGETPLEALLQARDLDPISVTRLRPGTPRDLATITMKCLEKEPTRRYASALALAEDLRRYRAGEPIQARPLGAVGRGWRWCRRNPSLAAVAALAGLALVAVVALSTAFGLHSSHKARELKEERDKVDRALADEQTQRQLADARARLARARLAEQELDQALMICANEGPRHGLLWLARAARSAPEGADDLQRTIRTNLAGWGAEAPTLRLVAGGLGLVGALAFSPDSRALATICGDGKVRLWDVSTGRQVGKLFRPEWGAVSVAFSPTGKTVLTQNGNSKAQLWDAATRTPIGPEMHPRQLRWPLGAFIVAVGYNPDGKTVLSAHTDGTAQLWDAATGEPLGESLAHGEGLRHLAFRRDGRVFATAGGGTVRLWRMEDVARLKKGGERVAATPLARLPSGLDHAGRDSLMAFSPDGGAIATGDRGGTVRLWEMGPEREWVLGRTAGRGLAFRADSKVVLAGTDSGIRLIEVATGRALGPPLLPRDLGLLTAAVFSPDGKRFVTCGDRLLGDAVQCWSSSAIPGPEGEWKRLGPPLKQFHVQAAAFSPDGRILLTSKDVGGVQLWDVATGKCLGPAGPEHRWARFVARGPTEAYGPGGTVVLRAAGNGARLSEAATGKALGMELLQRGQIVGVAFRADGKMVLTATEGGLVQLWDARTCKPLGPVFRLHERCMSTAFSPDGKTLVTLDVSSVLRWDVPTPLPGSPARIELWAQVRTGLELDEHNAVRLLDEAAWWERRRWLTELGGPPLDEVNPLGGAR
jgi:WD40 repeat protein